MKAQQQYHIDVTEEEARLFNEPPENNIEKKTTENRFNVISFKKSFFVILCIHVVGAAALFGIPQNTKNATEQENLTSPTPAPQTNTNIPSSSPTPIMPAVEAVKPIKQEQPTPQPELVATLKPTQLDKSFYTKEYVVKPGDNFYKIVKRYKLNANQLIKINDIKDVNKLKAGQKLKFM